MKRASTAHIGVACSLRVVGPSALLGFSEFAPLNGVYDLDYSIFDRVVYRRRGSTPGDGAEAEIFWDHSFGVGTWVIASPGRPVTRQLEPGARSPLGPYMGNRVVMSAAERPSFVEGLAFPAPQADLDFYTDMGAGEFPLLSYPGLVMLSTGGARGERIPAVHIPHPGMPASLRSYSSAIVLGQALVVDVVVVVVRWVCRTGVPA